METFDDVLLQQALKQVDNLVEQGIDRCNEVSQIYDFERAWVLEQFVKRFNKKANKVLKNEE